MTWTNFRLGRSAWAAAYICLMLLTAPAGVFGRLVAHVHQAFWCSVVEAAVLCPVGAITYLNRRWPAPRVLQPLALPLSFLWTEVACSRVMLWVRLFVVHASLSPSLADASVALDWSREGPYDVLSQGLAYLCIVQIVHNMTGVLRTFDAMVRSEADTVMEDAEPLFGNDPDGFTFALFERLVYAYLAGQGLLYGSLVRLFTAMALSLERIAVGTALTALVGAHNSLALCRCFIFFTVAHVILSAALLNMWSVHDEAHDEAEEQVRRQQQLAELGGDAPARRRPTANTAIPCEMLRRLGLRVGCLLEDGARRLLLLPVPPRAAGGPGRWRWLCPEFAALWPEDERRRFYAAALAGAPPAMLAALWDHGPLRRRHVELWRRAGLTTDFVVLGGETFVGDLGAGEAPPPWMVFFLGKIAAILVRGVEAAFGICLAVGGLVVVLTR